MKLSIIIPVHNNWNFTKAALKDLAKLPDDHEVILIDNGSTDQTQKSCHLWANPFIMCDCATPDHPTGLDRPRNLRVIINDDNKGFCFASNQGYQIAQGEYILFLNNDIRVQKDHASWTQKLIEAAADGSIVGPNGGLLDEHLNFIRETTTIETGNFYMSGWCFCAKKETFDKLIPSENVVKGPLSQEFFSYFEDTDLSFRARKLGIQFKIVPVPVVHFGKTTSKKLGISDMYLESKRTFITKWTNR
jgi:GT2 family glycosyltransferase